MSAEQIKTRIFRSYIRPEYFYLPVKEKIVSFTLTIRQVLRYTYDVELKDFTTSILNSWCKWQLINSDGEIVASSSASSYMVTVFSGKYRIRIVETNIYNPFKEFQEEYELDLTNVREAYRFDLIGTPSVFKYKYRLEEVNNIYDYDTTTGYAGEHIEINNASNKSIIVIADLYLDDILIWSSPMIGGINMAVNDFYRLYFVENPIYFDVSAYDYYGSSSEYITDTDPNACLGYRIQYRDENGNTNIDVLKQDYHNKIVELKENPNVTITQSNPWFRSHSRGMSNGVVNSDSYSTYYYMYGRKNNTASSEIEGYYDVLYRDGCMDVYYDSNVFNSVNSLNGGMRIFKVSSLVARYGVQNNFYTAHTKGREDNTNEIISDLINMDYDVLDVVYFKIGDVYVHDTIDAIMRNESYLNAVTPMVAFGTNINMTANYVTNNKTNPLTTQPRIFLENGDVEDLLFGGFKWCSPND